MNSLLAEVRALGQAGNVEQARALIRSAERDPSLPAAAWRAIGDAWHIVGDADAGGAAHLHALELSIRDRDLLTAADGLARNDLPVAEPLLRARLKEQPTDIAAIRMLAELAGR
ncbi:MAG TPA: hypothetical protein VK980_15200, partial [Sphingomonas sp.]|nr:hypothetical protein [Sphingomonas sp.]